MSRTLFLFSALTLLLSIMFVGPASAINDDAWATDMEDWGYRVPISITNPPTAANVQREINLTYQENMQGDFDDIRFRTSSGSSIDYWIEEKTDSSYANVWVELPSASMTYIYVYYDNPAATDAGSGNAVFNWYADFIGQSGLDTGVWAVHGTGRGNLAVADDEITITSTTSGTPNYGIHSVATPMGAGKCLHVTSKRTAGSYMTYIAAMDDPYLRRPHGDTTTNGVSFYGTESAGTRNIVSWASDANGAYFGDTEYTDLTTYTDFRIDWISSASVKVYVADGLITEITSYIPTGSFPVAFSCEKSVSGSLKVPRAFVTTYDAAATSFAIGTPEEPSDDTIIPFPGYELNPTDPDSDGLYEDCNGNGRTDFQDLILFFTYNGWAENNQPTKSYFDWSGNSKIEFSDVSAFWESEFT